MSILTENIIIVWLLPVLFQIVLPLLMLVFYFVLKLFSALKVSDRRVAEKTQSIENKQAEAQLTAV